MTVPLGTILELGAALARIILDVLNGTLSSHEAVARRVIGVGLDAVPIDELRMYLDEEARQRQDAAFEIMKREKFGESD